MEENEFEDLQNPSQKKPLDSRWQRLSTQFSVQFLVRIHFRRYEFDIVRKLILTSRINKLQDYLFIRNTLKEMESKVEFDPILQYHVKEMIELRRLAQAKINIMRKSETSQEEQT
ncbi:MAG: hypothetical protein H7A25_19125 [Leptospiraceae bacterium]|nr:hypothetical protein [Leptospiraceae bacterium]